MYSLDLEAILAATEARSNGTPDQFASRAANQATVAAGTGVQSAAQSFAQSARHAAIVDTSRLSPA